LELLVPGFPPSELLFLLQENGYCVKLFEKRNYSGGRMATRRTATYSIENGTQYFTARGNIFSNEVKKKKIAKTCKIEI
jgi:predicted NAD/FAD-dependent oxidoreductase